MDTAPKHGGVILAAMSARRKALFAVCCFVPLAVYGVGIAALAAGGIENDPLRNAFLGFTYVGMAIYIIGMVAAIVHVARREDFDGRRRTKWLLLIFFLNALVLPFFWWFLIRPLPRDSQTQG